MRVHLSRSIGALWISCEVTLWQHGVLIARDQNLTKFAIEDTLESYFFPERPYFPEGGKEFECPNCGHKATYQRTDLVYMH